MSDYEIYANSHTLGLVTIKDKDNLVILDKKDFNRIKKEMEW